MPVYLLSEWIICASVQTSTNVIIPHFGRTLILLLYIVSLSHSKQLWLKLRLNGFSKRLSAVCLWQTNRVIYPITGFKNTLGWLLMYISLWSAGDESLPLSQLRVTPVLKMQHGIQRLTVGCSRVPTNSSPHPWHTAPNLSLGYDCELLTGLSLKNVICSEQLYKLWYSLISDVKKLS